MTNDKLLELGLLGGEIVDDTSAHTGNWWGFQVIGGAAVVASVTQPDNARGTVTNAAGLASLTLAEGTIIKMPIASITLTSGAIQLFDLS